MPDNSHDVARWLDAAQAPVRARHCTQALMQQLDQLILDAIRDAPEETQGSVAEATSHELLGRSRRPCSARGMPGNLRAESVIKMSAHTTFWSSDNFSRPDTSIRVFGSIIQKRDLNFWETDALPNFFI